MQTHEKYPSFFKALHIFVNEFTLDSFTDLLIEFVKYMI